MTAIMFEKGVKHHEKKTYAGISTHHTLQSSVAWHKSGYCCVGTIVVYHRIARGTYRHCWPYGFDGLTIEPLYSNTHGAQTSARSETTSYHGNERDDRG